MITIIDYGMGNLGSIANMLKKVGAQVTVSSDAAVITKADKLILPGVGAFDQGMKNLAEYGLISLLNTKVLEDKTPILGICLGMQLLTNKSEEGILPGLGWIDAETVRFRFNNNHKNLKIPHMGWNTADIRGKSLLFDGLYPEPRFYFVHSYHVVCNNESYIRSKTVHGFDFVSSIVKENIVGVQFHPEKSHKYGMRLLENFVELF